MYTQLASRLNVVDNTPAFSQAVATAGTNAASVETTVFTNGAGDLEIDIEGSNDLENWSTIVSDVVPMAAGYIGYAEGTYYDNSGRPERIAFAYVRLRYSVTTGGAVVAAGINLFSS